MKKKSATPPAVPMGFLKKKNAPPPLKQNSPKKKKKIAFFKNGCFKEK